MKTDLLYKLRSIDLTNPREFMMDNGADTLSDTELLSVILGSGVKGSPVHVIAQKIIKKIEKDQENVVIEDLLGIPGLGQAKALGILAVIELGRRIFVPRKWKICSPSDLLPLLSHYSDRDQEHFIVYSLNGANEIISYKVISVGLLNRTLVHPREVFKCAINHGAAAIIVAHNHPSGNVSPSKEDITVTKNLVKSGKILDIRVLDHIVFSVNIYFSFLVEGIL